VKEVWLFDALYGGTDAFLGWQTDQNGRLLILYTDGGGTLDETKHAMALLQERGVDYSATEHGVLRLAELRANNVVFVHTDLAHHEVVAKGGLFAQFLGASSLEDQ